MGQNQVYILERCPLFRGSYDRGFSIPHIRKDRVRQNKEDKWERFTYFAQFDSIVW